MEKKDIEIGELIVDKKRTGSSFGAYFNIVCAVAGTGTLGLPYAIRIGGWLTMLVFILVSVLAIYTSKLLIECLYYQPGKRLEDFPDVGEAAFGKPGRYFVKFFHYLILLSCACIYILLIGLNIRDLVIQFHGSEILSQEIWILLSGIIVLVPSLFCKTLKEVAILATFGTLATVVCVICVVVLGGVEYLSTDYVAPKTELFNLSGFPLALATIAFSFGGNVIYPQIEATMKYPKQWNRVLIMSVITITLLYAIISGTGYLYYGNTTKSPILGSLPPVLGTQVTYMLITIHVVLATPIYTCAFSYDQEKWLKIDTEYMSKTKEFVLRCILRIALGAALTVVAMYVPFFEDLMALVGAISSCLIIFLVPIACHYKLFGIRGREWWQYVLTIISIIVGIVGLILGSIDAVTNLVKAFNGTKK